MFHTLQLWPIRFLGFAFRVILQQIWRRIGLRAEVCGRVGVLQISFSSGLLRFSDMDMSYLMSLLGFITLARSFLPPELNELLVKWWEKLIKPVNPFCNFHVPELESNITNDLYRVVQLHMRAAKLSKDADELVLSRDENEKEITFSLAGTSIPKFFRTQKCFWTHENGCS